MTPMEFRMIRRLLGLTQAQLAPLLGYSAATRITEIERDGATVPKQAMLLMRAYEDGYRPKDWARLTQRLDLTKEEAPLWSERPLGQR